MKVSIWIAYSVLLILLFLDCSRSADYSRISKNQLLDSVQYRTIKYFTEFAHPQCGLAVERSNEDHYSNDVVTIGGTGFGILAMIAGVERGFLEREIALMQLEKIVDFLDTCDRYHGAWSHWYFGSTGKTKAFSEFDNGGDIVESAFLVQGLLTALLEKQPKKLNYGIT
ncbi:hypothetical protein ES705_08563 [subsurface metagenome]